MLSVDALAKLLFSYIRINWTDCNTGSMLPYRSVTLGEGKECLGSPRPPTSPSIGGFGCPQTQQASRVNYKGPARLRKIMWAQWSIHARPPRRHQPQRRLGLRLLHSSRAVAFPGPAHRVQRGDYRCTTLISHLLTCARAGGHLILCTTHTFSCAPPHTRQIDVCPR